jgi:hypothetical protein
VRGPSLLELNDSESVPNRYGSTIVPAQNTPRNETAILEYRVSLRNHVLAARVGPNMSTVIGA